MKNLFTVSLLAAILVGCGGSSSGNSNSTAPSSITVQDLQVMQNVLDQTNTARDTLDTLLAAPQKVSFLARLNIGQEQVLATQGVLSVKARCIESTDENFLPLPPDGVEITRMREEPFGTKMQISYKSMVPGSLLADDDEGYLELEQGMDVIFSEFLSVSDINVDKSSVVAATGDHISINGETMMGSINAQGTDCMVAGIAFIMKGSIAGEFEIVNTTLGQM